jgi:hypothetical protein
MDVAKQLAIKRIHDEAGYNRQRVNALRNRQPDAITEGEVCVAVCELLADQGDEMYLFPRL